MNIKDITDYLGITKMNIQYSISESSKEGCFEIVSANNHFMVGQQADPEDLEYLLDTPNPWRIVDIKRDFILAMSYKTCEEALDGIERIILNNEGN